MRFVKFLLIVLLVAALATASYFLLDHFNLLNSKELTPLYMSQSIPFGKDEDIHFYKNGFIITGEGSRYYNGQGLKANNPFSQDDQMAGNDHISIKFAVGNYICTESDIIYDTTLVPFKPVFENTDNLSIYDMKEGQDFLVLLIEESENIVQPRVLINNTDFLLSYDGRGDSRYLSSSIYRDSKDLSILSISLDTPTPITRIFNYTNRNEAYGAITVEDQLLYDIYRIKSHVILIGTDTIICYNINGQKVWTVDNPSKASYEVVYSGGDLLLYFNDLVRQEDRGGNTIRVNGEGDFEFMDLPKYLSNINPYNNEYIAAELGNTLVFFDGRGQAKKRYRMEGLVRELYVSEYHEDMFYIKTQENTLAIYTNQRKDEQD
ncbi:MAG TPA: hypothetical protein VFD33_03290 [Bacillota bacterium]|nr:hypothetical protein [Bacillota bacterium]